MFDVIQLHVIVKMCSIVVCEIVTTVEHLGEIANEMLSFKINCKQGNVFKPSSRIFRELCVDAFPSFWHICLLLSRKPVFVENTCMMKP